MHQSDSIFVALLGRLWYGICTEVDFELLNKHIISPEEMFWMSLFLMHTFRIWMEKMPHP